MSITIKDVARLANVSLGTASMALNGKSSVNEQTKLKVLEAAQKLKYKPNHAARSLITNKSSTIGLIITDITNPFFGLIISHIQKIAEEAGYNMLLGISNDKIEKEKKAIEYIVSRNVEGFIIVPTLEEGKDLEHLYNLKTNDIPFVFITSAYKGIEADCVMTDLGQGTYELTDHLIKTGHKKIFIISGPKELLLSSKRTEGYKNALRQNGLEYRDEWIFESYPDFSGGYNTANDIIKQELPDAIITINDMLALGVLKSLKEHKIKVPEKISVAGYDDLIFSSIVDTPLTTVSQPIFEMCREALELLFKRIDGNTDPLVKKFLEPKLLVRLSTRNSIL